MTTATPERVTIDVVPDLSTEELHDGLAEAWAMIEHHELDVLYRDRPDDELSPPSGMAYEREVIDPAIAEIAPRVAALLTEAIRKRLPWTWEPER